ncbi:GPI mannosyltransferase 2-like [Diadema antillarum]|uniref:GPI mannosyltransferase 2-like n=1 Tax=Diadema antillarum TaxID=105358 RepID=UPI003A8B5A09
MGQLSMSQSDLKTVVHFAVSIRILLSVMQIILNTLIPDHEADAFHQDTIQNPTTGDRVVELALGGFRKWDGAYFLHIAENGYTKSHMFAFFPLLPFVVRATGDSLLAPLQVHRRSVLLVAGYLVNFVAFVLAVCALYRLSVKVLQDERLAYTASVLFCVNPASVFMCAVYTEATFSFLSLCGMLFVTSRRFFLSAVFFGLAAAARSNGLVSLGFVAYLSAQEVVRTTSATCMRVFNIQTLKHLCATFSTCVTRVLYSGVIIAAPFVLFQLLTHSKICGTYEFSLMQAGKFLSAVFRHNSTGGRAQQSSHEACKEELVPSWCCESFAIPYSKIQSSHWNVGFMRYYEFRQIPNFLLASPIITLSLVGAFQYCRANWEHVKCLGLPKPIRNDYKKTDMPTASSVGFFSPECFVYIVHLMALLLFGLTTMHIQVITRFLVSSSPAVLWYAAHVMQSSLTEGDAPGSPPVKQHGPAHEGMLPMDIVWRRPVGWKGRLVRGYFLSYCVIGIALHCNFLPWT